MSLLLPLLALLTFTLPAPPSAAPGLVARVTWYLPSNSRMANGQYPFPGAAACSSILPFGTKVRLNDTRTVTCLDRGHLERELWIDVFASTPEEGRRIAREHSPYSVAQIIRSANAE